MLLALLGMSSYLSVDDPAGLDPPDFGMSSYLSVDDPAGLDPPGVTPGRPPGVTPGLGGGGGGGVELLSHLLDLLPCSFRQRAKFSGESSFLCPFWCLAVATRKEADEEEQAC